MEDILAPGYSIVYNGITLPTITKYTISTPQIQPSKYYKFLLQTKNCGRFSSGVTLTAASASVPSTVAAAPKVLSYDSTTAMTISWSKPL